MKLIKFKVSTGPWIKSSAEVEDHRKIIEVARELQIPPVYVSGHMHALWHSALKQREDGDLSEWSDQFIAEKSKYVGDAKIFVGLLRKYSLLGYFDEEGNIVSGTENLLHDWLDYAGNYLYSKYHTSNPKKLKEIYKKHQSAFRQPKGGLKVDFRQTKGDLKSDSSPPKGDLKVAFRQPRLDQIRSDKKVIKKSKEGLSLREEKTKKSVDNYENSIEESVTKKTHEYPVDNSQEALNIKENEPVDNSKKLETLALEAGLGDNPQESVECIKIVCLKIGEIMGWSPNSEATCVKLTEILETIKAKNKTRDPVQDVYKYVNTSLKNLKSDREKIKQRESAFT